MFHTGGKPSTWFPPVGLVELYDLRNTFSRFESFQNSKILYFSLKSQKMTSYQKFEVRWKFHLHYHQVLILSQNETSIHEEYFACGTFSYQRGFVNEKPAQRRPCYKKSRCPWDGVYLRTSITLRALPSDKQLATSGEPSTWFPLG